MALVTARLDAAARLSLDELRASAMLLIIAVNSTGWSIDLGTYPGRRLSPTDKRIAANATTGDPALAALFVQYGRYLMLASSRPGTQPANLQGIWNDLTDPPWGSKYTVNINTEMNYWLPDIANLGECMEPLLRLAEEVAVTGRETARVMYGAPGWVLHHNTDLWRATAPIDGAFWGLWPTGGAWLCAQLWDHVSFGASDDDWSSGSIRSCSAPPSSSHMCSSPCRVPICSSRRHRYRPRTPTLTGPRSATARRWTARSFATCSLRRSKPASA